VATEGDAPAKYDAAATQFMSYAGTIAGLTSQLQRGKDYDYRPGVKLGDAEALVFWHRDKEKGTYRAVRGDLSVTDLKAADVPPPVKETLPRPTRVEAGAAAPRAAAPPARATPEPAPPAEAKPPTRVTPETAPAQPG
jgi:hypothetical protein